MYDATIRYVDDTVRSIVECADRFDDPVIVVTPTTANCSANRGLLAHSYVLTTPLRASRSSLRTRRCR